MLAKDEILQGRYQIVRQLGHGGMGAVYEARDKRLGSSVALKEIIIEIDKIPTESKRELFRRAFEREAKLLANLHHEVFPRVMDYFSEENRQFLIMELVSGDDLGELLQKKKEPFALEKIVNWADQLLDALDYLHTQKPSIFHRDIKPPNLKVTFRGKIKLLDFGIAKSVDQSGSTITNQTFVGATLNYAPIEQVLPATPTTFREFIVLKHSEKAEAVLNQNTDARCDLYAVGATFYHLLTNCVPLDSAKRCLEIWEGRDDPLVNPSEIDPAIPPSISDCLLKAMEVDRDDRFSTALEMLEALQTAVAEEKEKNKTAQTIPLFTEQQHLPIEEKESFPKITEAKTANLLDISEKSETGKEISADTLPSPTEASVKIQSSDTFFPDEITPTDFTFSDTDIPAIDSSKGETAGLEIDDDFFSERSETESEAVRLTQTLPPQVFADSSADKPKFYLAFPIIGILSIFVLGGGIFGIISWMNYSGNSSENNSTIENTNLEKTAEVTPTIEANFNTSEANTNIESTPDTKVSDEPKEDKPKPTVQPTSNPIVKQTQKTVPKPKPTVKQTPKPKSTKQVTADDLMKDN